MLLAQNATNDLGDVAMVRHQVLSVAADLARLPFEKRVSLRGGESEVPFLVGSAASRNGAAGGTHVPAGLLPVDGGYPAARTASDHLGVSAVGFDDMDSSPVDRHAVIIAMAHAVQVLAAGTAVETKPVNIFPGRNPGPWMTMGDEGLSDDVGEMFVQNPRWVTKLKGPGWASGVPQDTGPEDQAERIWRQVKYSPGEGRFYHPDTGEDVGEPEWGHFRSDRRLFVSAIAQALVVLARGTKVREKIDLEHLIGNTMDHYRNATPDQQTEGRWWYRGAHEATKDLSNKTIHDFPRAAGIMAGLSPHEEWGNNLQNGMHFLLNYRPENKYDWQQSYIHPKVHQQWMADVGHEPKTSNEMEAYADAHGQVMPEMADPNIREEWLNGLAHTGVDTQLARMTRAVAQARKKKVKSTGLPGVFNPQTPIGSAGLPTIGGNVERSKAIFNAPRDQWQQHLSGPKINSFYNNIVNATPINDQGYYHDLSDQDAVIDTHMVRAMAQPHGGTLETRYLAPPELSGSEIDPVTRKQIPVGYNLYRHAVQEATRRMNADRAPHEQLTPKQVQATVWLKFKEDLDRQKYDANAAKWEAKNPGKTYPGPKKAPKGELAWPNPNYTPEFGEEYDPRRQLPDIGTRPNWMRPMARLLAMAAMIQAREILR